MADQFVGIDRVLDFVGRTVDHGVPLRVAVVRAERRFGVKRSLVRSFYVTRARVRGPQ